MPDNSLEIMTSHVSDEHYTPSFLIEAAREVMGSIDLDPMSNLIANKTVKADSFYSKENNGLDKEWHGNVWLNPPFTLANQSVKKLIDSYETRKVTQAVLLLKSAVETKRYQLLYPYPFCELNQRVRYMSPNELFSDNAKNNKCCAPFSTVLFYLGSDFLKWERVMFKLGRVHPGNRLFTQLRQQVNYL